MAKRKDDSRTARGLHRRKVEERPTIDRFLIVCEGSRTEPNYFLKFRVPREVATVEVHGPGYNTVSLVEETLRLRDKGGYTEDGDQVWCVFDRDSFPKAQFNEAIQLAESNGLHVAYSNEAFELWYLLHFHYYDTGIHRKQYILKLTKLLTKLRGHPYEKNSSEMYDILLSKQAQAIHNARKLYEAKHSPSPANDNPSTTVFLLIEELRKFSR